MGTVPTEPEVRKAAHVTDCGRYRYWLARVWDDARRPATFVMLNPSTADAAADDPTIRRCMGFARSWGCGGILVVNLYALRATDPKALLASASLPDRKRVDVARGLFAGVEVKCFGRTKGGHPRHPLYVPAATTLEVWPAGVSP